MIEKENSIEVSQFTLKELIRQTIFSISDSESNKMMGGELFEIKDNILRVVSLDGHRISIRRIELKEETEDKKLIVPGKTPDRDQQDPFRRSRKHGEYFLYQQSYCL